MSESVSPTVRRWNLLFGALCATAGHGLFLALAVALRSRVLQPAQALGVVLIDLLVAWFVLAIPLAFVVLARREALLRSARLGTYAGGYAFLTSLAFAAYAFKIVSD
jgi:hypothetical protein